MQGREGAAGDQRPYFMKPDGTGRPVSGAKTGNPRMEA